MKKSSERYRLRGLETALLVLEFLSERQGRLFRPHELATHVGFCRRTAYRWLTACEGMGWVETEPTGGPLMVNGRERLNFRSTMKVEKVRRR